MDDRQAYNEWWERTYGTEPTLTGWRVWKAALASQSSKTVEQREPVAVVESVDPARVLWYVDFPNIAAKVKPGDKLYLHPAPATEAEPASLIERIRALADATKAAGPGVAVPIPADIRAEAEKFMRDEPSEFDALTAKAMMQLAADINPAPAMPAEPEVDGWPLYSGIPPAPATARLPNPGSPEASAMIDSLLAEYHYPTNTKNAARAGYMAAVRLLGAGAPAMPAGDLPERITVYLSGGGLFNPELANHDAVRDLLIECRAALAAREPLTPDKIQRCWSPYAGCAPFAFARAIEAAHGIGQDREDV